MSFPFTTILPVPSRKKTRAVAVFLLPVPIAIFFVLAISILLYSNFQGLGVLRCVRMLRSSVDSEVLAQAAAKNSAGEHAFNGQAHRIFRMALQKLFVGERLESANKACVMMVKLFLFLGASYDSLGRVDYDYKVTHLLVGSVSGLILSANDRSGLGGNASERLSGGVNDVPLASLFLFVYKNPLSLFLIPPDNKMPDPKLSVFVMPLQVLPLFP